MQWEEVDVWIELEDKAKSGTRKGEEVGVGGHDGKE